MKKKFLFTLLTFVLLFLITPNVYAKEISVTIDGTLVSFDQPPIIENGRTLVPLRAIFEALGADVIWDGDSRTAFSTKDNTSISITIGSNTLYKNNQPIILDVPAKILNGRTLVPVRAIAESFGCEVKWDGENNHVKILTQSAFDILKNIIIENNVNSSEEDDYMFYWFPPQIDTLSAISMSYTPSSDLIDILIIPDIKKESTYFIELGRDESYFKYYVSVSRLSMIGIMERSDISKQTKSVYPYDYSFDEYDYPSTAQSLREAGAAGIKLILSSTDLYLLENNYPISITDLGFTNLY